MSMSVQNLRKTKKETGPAGGNYSQVVAYLDSLKNYEYSENSLNRMNQLDKHLGNISEQIDTIVVGGTNGKSLSIHFATKLLRKEGFNVGVSYSSHFLNYNERVLVNFESISNKDFTDVLNEVISVAQNNNIKATRFEILTISSLLFFKKQNVDVALLEVGIGGKFDATNFCNPKISAVTRIAMDHSAQLGQDLDVITDHMLAIARAGSWFISAEQSKLRLQKMKNIIEGFGSKWAMPIRKLANLPYIFEQLYGRVVSLGERIAQIYVEDIKQKFSPFLRGNLLATQKGQRGRPTLEAKKQAELNPIKSLKNFWNEQFDLLNGRFELLDKEKPSILLDCAHNLDAYNNLFLGIRLLHYQRPLRGLALIIGIDKETNFSETLKLIRYLLKKISGQIFFVPIKEDNSFSFDAQELEEKIKEFNLKGKAFSSFDQAFNVAKELVDNRDGLICVTGSVEMVGKYWNQRGIKKV